MNLLNKLNMPYKIVMIILASTALYYSYPVIAFIQNIIFSKVYFMSIFIKFIILIFLLLLIKKNFINKKFNYDLIGKNFFIILIFSILSLIFLFRFNFPFVYNLFSYNVQMFWIFLLSIIYCYSEIEESNKKRIFQAVTGFIISFFIINFLFALLQHIQNKPLFEIAADEKYYQTFHHYLAGKYFRASGFMFSGLDFGILSALSFFIFVPLTFQLKSYQRAISIIFSFVALYGVFISYTRVPYLIFILGSIFQVIYFLKWKRILKFIPLIYFMFGFLVAIRPKVFYKLYELFISPSNYYYHYATIKHRTDSWTKSITDIKSWDIMNYLFGAGVIQNNRTPGVVENLYIDNLYLSIVYYNGVPVLLVFMILFSLVYLKGIEKIFNQLDEGYKAEPVIVGGFTLLAALAGASFFNCFIQEIYIYMLIPILFLSGKLVSEKT